MFNTHTHTIVSRERENHTESNSKKHDEFIQGYWKICIAGVLRAIKSNCKPCIRLKPLQAGGVAIGAGIRSTGGAATPPGLKLLPPAPLVPAPMSPLKKIKILSEFHLFLLFIITFP